MSRIELGDSGMDVVIKLGDGNMGAVTVLAKLLQGNHWKTFLRLDTLGIYGSHIWMLYKDVCKQDLEEFRKEVKARFLGEENDD